MNVCVVFWLCLLISVCLFPLFCFVVMCGVELRSVALIMCLCCVVSRVVWFCCVLFVLYDLFF